MPIILIIMISELSVFFPCYNEEANVENTVKKALAVLESKSLKNYEVIIVDDGSKDKTGEIADRLADESQHIRVIHHHPNRGYGGALISGLYNSRFDWIAFTDADGQFDFAEIDKFLEYTDKYDLIVGYREKRADPFIRKLNAKIFNLVLFFVFGLKVKDADCGFKLIRKEVLDKITEPISGGAVTEPELLIKAKKGGFKIKEVSVSHYPRRRGKQTGANLKVILKALRELIQLWKELKD